MTFIPLSRRRFLQTSLAAAGALSTGLGARSSRDDEPGDLPFEVNEADAAEQERELSLDEDDYR